MTPGIKWTESFRGLVQIRLSTCRLGVRSFVAWRPGTQDARVVNWRGLTRREDGSSRNTDPEPYITEYTLAYEDKISQLACVGCECVFPPHQYSGVTLNVARPDMNNYATLGVMLY